MRSFWGTTLLVFKEGSRKKIFLTLLTFGVLVLIFTFVLSDITFADKGRVILDSGKALMLLFAIFYILFLGSSWLSENLSEGSLDLLLSKPLSRETYLIGKFVGDLFLLGVILFFMSSVLEIVLLLYARITSWMPFLYGISIFLESGVLLSITFFFALFTSPFVTFFAGLGVFMVGSSLDILFRSVEKSPPLLSFIFKPMIVAWPDFNLFDIDRHFLSANSMPLLFLILSLYAFGYLIFFLGVVCLFWRRMDLS